MKTKKPISVLLALLMILTLIPLSVFTASAQECNWSYYIGETRYSTAAALNAANITGLKVEYGQLVLNNYKGTSIAARADGTIGEDDSPVLNIRLVGDNKLTGGYFKYSTSDGLTVKGNTKVTGDDCFFGALVSEPRAGVYGDDSVINISGDGTLDITLTKSYSKTIDVVHGKPTTVEKKSDVNIKGVFCGDFNVYGGKVNITFGGNGVTTKNVTGVEGNVYARGGVVNIKAAVAAARVRSDSGITRVESKCAVYGVDGNVRMGTNDGYFASELASVKTSSADVTAVNGSVSYENAYGALYLSAPAGGKTSPGKVDTATFIENVSYRKFAFSDEKYVYEAYGPADTDDLAYNKSLSEITAAEVKDQMTFPGVGEEQLFETACTLYSDNGFFMKETSYKTDSGNGQHWASDSWSKYEICDALFVYEFDAYVYPTAGRWYIPYNGQMSTHNVNVAFMDLHQYDATAQSNGFDVFFRYDTTITRQPEPTLYDRDQTVEVEATASTGTLSYEWWIEVYDADGELASAFAIGKEYGDMDGWPECYESTLELAGFSPDDEVPGTSGLTYGKASEVLLYCKVKNTKGITVDSEKSVYNMYATITKQPENAEFGSDGKVKFTCAAEGRDIHYQWYMDGVKITSASNKSGQYGFGGYATATLTVVAESETGASLLKSKKFTCVATDASGMTDTSAEARILNIPTIVKQPENCDYFKGAPNPTFTVTASGNGLSYQWYWGDVALDSGFVGGFNVTGGKTDTVIVVSNGNTIGLQAKTEFYCVVSNADGKVTTNKVKIVEATPTFTTQPKNCTVASGSKATFTAVFEKTDGVTYKWYTSDGIAIKDTSTAPAWTVSGSDTNTISITPKTPYAYTLSFYCEATYKGVKFKSDTVSLIQPHTCKDNLEKVEGKAVTCLLAGRKEHYKCTMCEKLYADAAATMEIEAKDTVIAALGHNWGTGKVTKEATASTKGERTFTCANCGKTRVETFDYVKPETPDFMLGDINDDKKVDAADARLALRKSVNLEKYAPGSREFLAGDVDKNNAVDAADARHILRASVKLEDPTKW